MFKKALSLLLSLMLIVTSISVTAISVSAADDVTYVVAGVEALCGVSWKGDTAEGADNIMTQNADGTYSKVYTDVAVMNDYQLKVVANDAAGNMTWYGIDGGNDNVTFHVIEACDVTVTFDPSTLKLTVTGDGVEIPTGLQIDAMRAVGNGDGNWLNGVSWDPADDANLMEETSAGVYEITFTELEEFDNYQVKFAANGSWATNWGGLFTESGVETDAVFNSNDNITFAVPYELANVTIKLDIRNFDFASKTGAKFTVTITDATAVETEPVEVTTAPVQETTEAPATEATTTAPVAEGLTVKATSNLFAEYTQNIPASESQVTVTYMINCAKDLLNTQWTLTYDPEVLKYNRTANIKPTGRGLNLMPQVSANGVFNVNEAGKILGNATDLGLYPLSNNGEAVAFVTVTFDVIGSGSTTVDLYIDVLNVSTVGDDFMTDVTQEESIVDFGKIQNFDVALDSNTYVYPGTYNPAPTYPVVETTVAPTTVEPTTVAPATEPTTEAPVVSDVRYVVAGSETLCGVNWDGASADNEMTLTDGVYTKVYEFVAPDTYQLKVVENFADGSQSWNGDETGNNITFNVLSECDVTVTFDPATKAITVTGAGVQMVTDLEIDAIRAVGNGDGTWLNGVSWDPADDANVMTEIADKVYSITFEDVDEFDNYQVKFAANGNWNDNWGGNFIDFGLETDAEYNSASNITFAVPYELADVTITLDLTNFNYSAKTGAKYTIAIEDASAPVPTEPTTEAPTTEPPTTEPVTTAPVVSDVRYVVAGSETLCGVNWDGASADNEMTLTDGVYTKVYEFVAPDTYQLKVVENFADGSQSWNGDETGNNITFNVLSECDVTVTFDPATKAITVTGAGVQMVTDLEIDAIRAVGNGDGTWLNGVSWDPADDANVMTEIADKVYSITFEDVDEFDNYQVKFAANGNWNDNWGGNFIDFGLETDAEYNSASNITFAVPYELADVTITLDLTNFNYSAKTGAKYTIAIEDASAPVSTEPTTAPANTLKVNATSNFFGTDDAVVEYTDGKTVTVTYFLQSEKDVMNAQWALSYDSALLKVKSVSMPNTADAVIREDMLEGSCSNLNLYDFKTSKAFVEVEFEVLGAGEAEVILNVTDLTVSKVNDNGISDENEELSIVVNGAVVNITGISTSTVIGGAVEPTTEAPTTEPVETTEPTTEAPTTEPVETTEPTTEAPTTEPVETTEPTTEAPTTEPAETTEPTDATEPDATEEPTTVPAPDQDPTSATGATVDGTSTSDTPSNNKPNSDAVQTGNASMAIVILLVLVSASAVLYFARKRVR